MKSYEELLAENEALAAQVEVIRCALNNQLNDCISFDGGKLTDCVMLASSVALKALPQQCLAEIKAEAIEEFCKSLDGLAIGQAPTSDDCSEDMITGWKAGNVDCRIAGMRYAAKIRNAGTWLKDSNVNGGKRQGGEK